MKKSRNALSAAESEKSADEREREREEIVLDQEDLDLIGEQNPDFQPQSTEVCLDLYDQYTASNQGIVKIQTSQTRSQIRPPRRRL